MVGLLSSCGTGPRCSIWNESLPGNSVLPSSSGRGCLTGRPASEGRGGGGREPGHSAGTSTPTNLAPHPTIGHDLQPPLSRRTADDQWPPSHGGEGSTLPALPQQPPWPELLHLVQESGREWTHTTSHQGLGGTHLWRVCCCALAVWASVYW